MQQVDQIKTLETRVIQKKEEKRQKIKELAKERIETIVKNTEQTRTQLEEEIHQLEQREKDLLARLKQTQNNHQQHVDDIERIRQNERPLVISEDSRSRTPKRK